MGNILKELSVKHPYYCSDSNYYSNDPGDEWETMTDFLDEYENADIDMNLIFRFDISPRGDEGVEAGRYYAEVFIIHQRKGIFAPHHIKHINEIEAIRFVELINKHWKVISTIWEPVSREGRNLISQKYLDQKELSKIFRKHVRDSFDWQKDAARHYRYNDQYFSGMCRGQRGLPDKILKELGYKKVTLYMKTPLDQGGEGE
jgi:hypothetical protein